MGATIYQFPHSYVTTFTDAAFTSIWLINVSEGRVLKSKLAQFSECDLASWFANNEATRLGVPVRETAR